MMNTEVDFGSNSHELNLENTYFFGTQENKNKTKTKQKIQENATFEISTMCHHYPESKHLIHNKHLLIDGLIEDSALRFRITNVYKVKCRGNNQALCTTVCIREKQINNVICTRSRDQIDIYHGALVFCS